MRHQVLAGSSSPREPGAVWHELAVIARVPLDAGAEEAPARAKVTARVVVTAGLDGHHEHEREQGAGDAREDLRRARHASLVRRLLLPRRQRWRGL